MSEACVTFGGMKGKVYSALVGNTKGRRPLGRPRMGWRRINLSNLG